MATLDMSNLPFDPQKAREEAARRQVAYERELAQEQAASVAAGSAEAKAYQARPNVANKQRLGGLRQVLQGKVEAYVKDFRAYKDREIEVMVERDRESGRRGFVTGLAGIAGIATAGAGAAVGASALGAAGFTAGAGVGGMSGYEIGRRVFDEAVGIQKKMDLGNMPDLGKLPNVDLSFRLPNAELAASSMNGVRGGDIQSLSVNGMNSTGSGSASGFTPLDGGRLYGGEQIDFIGKMPSLNYKTPIGQGVEI